jgi:hypothetical protein
MLGIGRQTLIRRMVEYQLPRPKTDLPESSIRRTAGAEGTEDAGGGD